MSGYNILLLNLVDSFCIVKQEKLDTKDMKEKIDKPDRPRKTSNKKSNSLVATDIDESALDSFGADLLPLDGKDEFGDLLDVFDTNESFHDVEVKSSSKPPSTKKVRNVCNLLVEHSELPFI